MSSFARDILRTIARKPGRFIALLAIVALGAGFYAGLRMTSPDMKLAVDDYFDATATYDVRVVSTMGLEQADLDALGALPSVEAVMGGYQSDALATFGDKSYTTRLHSLPAAANDAACEDGVHVESADDSYLNRLILSEGRWPEAPGECVISADRVLSKDVGLGSRVVLDRGVSDLRDVFAERAFTVVGRVHMPYYVSSAAIDASTLGSGVVQQVLYVPEGAFAESLPLTDAFVTVRGARGLRYGTDAYDAAVDAAIEEIEGIAEERCAARRDSLADQLIDDAFTYGGLLDLFEYRVSHTQDELDNPEMPEWLVMDRSKNAGTASFMSDSERVDRIASIFPLMFFLVAALVALTTMTRMVDEERQVIGTYKALGYSRAQITWKYVAYVLLAGVTGSVIGIAVLSQLLPGVIMNAYAIMYYVPVHTLGFDWPIALLSGGVTVGITLVATWASATATLREKPSALMLPRAPKSGKRILLERFGALWRRLSFTWKVTCRNLFRYKKRLVMTVMGIAGCTALLLTGLGLHDAINDIIDVQYGEIVHYNAELAYEDRMGDGEREKLEEALFASGAVTSSTGASSETMLAAGPRAQDKRIDVVVPFDAQAFEQMKTLRDRVTHNPVHLDESEVLLNEKMAQELGVGMGDVIRVSPQDAMGNATTTVYEFTVGALYENYIYNYLYVTPAAYEQATGAPPVENALFANIVDDAGVRGQLDEALGEIKAVKTLAYNDETLDTYRTMLRSVDLIVVVLVVCAAALAFIVLYNLTNINIEERIREIATLKVLGFTRRETNSYIFREIAILAVLGAVAGLFAGVVLEGFVVTTAEVDQVMFGRSIHPPSFVVGFVLTMLFSGVSMLLMRPKLARVDMVESLKSLE